MTDAQEKNSLEHGSLHFPFLLHNAAPECLLIPRSRNPRIPLKSHCSFYSTVEISFFLPQTSSFHPTFEAILWRKCLEIQKYNSPGSGGWGTRKRYFHDQWSYFGSILLLPRVELFSLFSSPSEGISKSSQPLSCCLSHEVLKGDRSHGSLWRFGCCSLHQSAPHGKLLKILLISSFLGSLK